jgi:hypothetical protein
MWAVHVLTHSVFLAKRRVSSPVPVLLALNASATPAFHRFHSSILLCFYTMPGSQSHRSSNRPGLCRPPFSIPMPRLTYLTYLRSSNICRLYQWLLAFGTSRIWLRFLLSNLCSFEIRHIPPGVPSRVFLSLRSSSSLPICTVILINQKVYITCQ